MRSTTSGTVRRKRSTDTEQISGQELDDFFETWLYTPTKPEDPEVALAARSTAATGITAKLVLRTNRR
jgi:hypothetical protein